MHKNNGKGRAHKLYHELKEDFSRDASEAELHVLAEALVAAEKKGWKAVDEVMRLADELLGTHGVEAIPGGVMLNSGDIYNATIIFCEEKREFEVTTHADFVEQYGSGEYEENPLKKGYSQQAISDNIEREMRAGRDQRQAAAIAYSTARRAWKAKHPGKAYPAHLKP